jgi:hypothetical protein
MTSKEIRSTDHFVEIDTTAPEETAPEGKASVPRLGRIGNDRIEWLMCLNAAATIAAAHNHSLGRDPTTVDPIALADHFYVALQARSFSSYAK